jgi:hydroxymethylbilane synthase
VQCRADDAGTRELLAAIDHEPSHRSLRAERAVLAALGGSCTVPVGAFAERDDGAGDGGALRVSGLIASGDGHTVIRLARSGDDPEAVGGSVARALLEGGGAAIEGFGHLLDAAP